MGGGWTAGGGAEFDRRGSYRAPGAGRKFPKRAAAGQPSGAGLRFIFDMLIFDHAYTLIRIVTSPLDPSCFDPEAPRISYAYFLYE